MVWLIKVQPLPTDPIKVSDVFYLMDQRQQNYLLREFFRELVDNVILLPKSSYKTKVNLYHFQDHLSIRLRFVASLLFKM